MSLQARIRSGFDWFFRDEEGRIVIWQTPNAPLLVWAVCAVLSYVIKHGIMHVIFMVAGVFSLVVWALLELLSGVTPFRRALGGAVLMLVVLSHLWY